MVLRKNYEIMGKKCYIPLYKPILKIKFTKKKFYIIHLLTLAKMYTNKKT